MLGKPSTRKGHVPKYLSPRTFEVLIWKDLLSRLLRVTTLQVFIMKRRPSMREGVCNLSPKIFSLTQYELMKFVSFPDFFLKGRSYTGHILKENHSQKKETFRSMKRKHYPLNRPFYRFLIKKYLSRILYGGITLDMSSL